MVATKDQWESMTPEQKIEVLADDARDLRGKIGDLTRRIDNVVAKVDRHFLDMATRIQALEARLPHGDAE